MQFFGIQKLERAEDWRPIVSDKNFQKGYSGYELAYSWQAAREFPSKVASVFNQADFLLLTGIRCEYGIVEKPVFLDTLIAPSWTDVMVYCKNASGDSVIVAVEGKCRESFGPIIQDWIRAKGEPDEGPDPKPSRLQRLSYLGDQLGITIPPTSQLRYQLVHRTVSAVKECNLHSAAATVVLVHSFDDKFKDNWDDYCKFTMAVGLISPAKDLIQGPVSLRGVQVFFAWVSDRRRV